MTPPFPDPLLGPLLERAAIGVGVLDEQGRYLYVNERLAEVNGVTIERHIGRKIREVIPHIADVVEAMHTEVLATGAPIRDVQIKGTTLGAPDRSWLVSYLPIEVAGRPAVGAVLVDTTDRDRAAEEVQRRVRQHAAVADLGQRALAGASISELQAAATAMVRAELAADQSGLLEFAPDRSHLVMCAGSGWPASAVGNVTAELGRRSQAGFTLIEGAPTLSIDLDAEDRFQVSPAMRAQGTRSAISTTIPGEDEPHGVLGVFSQAVGHFDEDDASFVRAMANVLGAAAVRDRQARALSELSGQRGRLVAQALEANEREHRNVADILHDDVLQHLLFARQELTSGAGDDAASRAGESIEEAVRTLRRVVAGLHPVTLAHAGLAAALESLASEHETRTGLRVEVEVDPAAVGTHDRLVVSVVRELLTNVSKHAEAQRARVSVTCGGNELDVVVADDGRGMPTDAFESALARGSMGLAITRERVEAIGGKATVCPGIEGGGTGIQIRIPL